MAIAYEDNFLHGDVVEEEVEKSDAALMRRYVLAPTRELRNEVVLCYMWLVERIAGQKLKSLPTHVEVGDLISAGTFGLIDAISKYDPERNVEFRNYAALRIQGAIIDELRHVDWSSRPARRRSRALQKATDRLEQQLQRKPTKAEIAAELDLSTQEVDRVVADFHSAALISFGQVVTSESGSKVTVLGDLIVDRNAEDREVQQTWELALQDLVKLIREMPATSRPRQVLERYYINGESITSIAADLGVTQSRVSQLKHEGLNALRRSVQVSEADPSEPEETFDPRTTKPLRWAVEELRLIPAVSIEEIDRHLRLDHGLRHLFKANCGWYDPKQLHWALVACRRQHGIQWVDAVKPINQAVIQDKKSTNPASQEVVAHAVEANLLTPEMVVEQLGAVVRPQNVAAYVTSLKSKWGLKPVKTHKGQRLYSPDDVQRVRVAMHQLEAFKGRRR